MLLSLLKETGMTKLQKLLIRSMLKDVPPSRNFLLTRMLHIYRWQGKAIPCKLIRLSAHSTRVRDHVMNLSGDPELAQAALFHDCEEVYTTDIPAPIKQVFSSLRNFSKALRKEIFKLIGIKWPSPRGWYIIHQADIMDRNYERKLLEELNLWLQ